MTHEGAHTKFIFRVKRQDLHLLYPEMDLLNPLIVSNIHKVPPELMDTARINTTQLKPTDRLDLVDEGILVGLLKFNHPVTASMAEAFMNELNRSDTETAIIITPMLSLDGCHVCEKLHANSLPEDQIKFASICYIKSQKKQKIPVEEKLPVKMCAYYLETTPTGHVELKHIPLSTHDIDESIRKNKEEFIKLFARMSLGGELL